MERRIINCYELDLRQDIPAEMELIKSSNEELKNSNWSFTIILFSIGVGVILFAVYHSSKRSKDKEDR